MIGRDLPLKQCDWRNDSFLVNDPVLWDAWKLRLDIATDWSLWILTFRLTGAENGPHPVVDHFEPVMHTYGRWRHMGKQRMYTTEEIMMMDELVSIELIRETFPRK